MVVDARGIVTGWSEGARRLTGHPAEEAVGRAVRALLAEDTPPRAPLRSGPVTLRHRDGHPHQAVQVLQPQRQRPPRPHGEDALAPRGRRQHDVEHAQRLPGR